MEEGKPGRRVVRRGDACEIISTESDKLAPFRDTVGLPTLTIQQVAGKFRHNTNV